MRHFWLRNEQGFPVACIASTLQPDSTIAFAIAITNPKDVFNRKMGRQIAEGRLNSGKVNNLFTTGPVKHAILEQLRLNAGNPPKRVRDAAKLWLDTHPLDYNRRNMKLHGSDTVHIEQAADLSNTIVEPSHSPLSPLVAEMEPYTFIAEPLDIRPEVPEPYNFEAEVEVSALEQEPEIEINVSADDQAKLDKMFSGVHSREERPFSWSDAPTIDEAFKSAS